MNYKIILSIISFSFLSFCCKKASAETIESIETRYEFVNEITPTTVHKDSTFEYEYRTGTSGNYKYNYDVYGTDEDGNDITGNVSMNGKYGSGTIINFDGEEIEIESEWTDYGILKATDNEGNEYELEVQH